MGILRGYMFIVRLIALLGGGVWRGMLKAREIMGLR
jgi:hypothetical protein